MSDLLTRLSHFVCDSTWSKMEFQLTSQMCCICPTPGTCLTTGLVTNLTRNIAKDSFSPNSSQLYISAKVLSRWYEYTTKDCSVLRQFAVFNPPLITWYQITNLFLPSFLPIPYSFRQIHAFRTHQQANSSEFFSPQGGNSLMVLFYHYRYSKNPRITT